MFLELTDIPSADKHGGVLAFAAIPWRIELGEGATLRERALRAMHEWHRLYGSAPIVRLVLEDREEWYAVLRDPQFLVACVGICAPDESSLASWLGIESVAWPGPRGLTTLEERAASEIRAVIADVERETGRRLRYHARNETERTNLTRAAASIGLMFEGNVLVSARPLAVSARRAAPSSG